MIATDIPFLLTSVYLVIGVPFSVPNGLCVIFGFAACAGVATAPSPSTASKANNLLMKLLPLVRPQCERSHATLSSPGRAAAGADDELRGDLEVRRSAVGRLHRVEQQAQAAAPHLV